MTTEPIDIVIPVWNRPVETRACLVSLVENTSNARLVLVDNSSDRETERMLEEFAEALDVRVLFLKNRINEGFVKAVNRGLSLTSTRFVAVVRQSSIVRPHWLEPLLDYVNKVPDSGIVVPGLYGKGSKQLSSGKRAGYKGMEISSADFAAFLMRRSLLESVGSFNEEMDGAVWCLKEYSRRAWKAGYRTCIVPESRVEKDEEVKLGSPARRAEHEERMRAEFTELWGEERAYCINLPKGSDLTDIQGRFKLITAAARQGNRIMILSHPSIASALVRAGFNQRHENISIVPLSRMMTDRSARKAVSDFSACGLPVTHVSWDDGGRSTVTPDSVIFTAFENIVKDNEHRYYKRDIYS